MKTYRVNENDPRPFESVSWSMDAESPHQIWDKVFAGEELANTGVENICDELIIRTVIRDGEFVEISIELEE
jgi:hypothetical protein